MSNYIFATVKGNENEWGYHFQAGASLEVDGIWVMKVADTFWGVLNNVDVPF